MRCAIFARRKHLRRSALSLAMLWLIASLPLYADNWSAELSVQGRYFLQSTADPRQDQLDLSFAGRADYFRDWDNQRQRFAMAVSGRIDSDDGARSQMDIGELYWRYRWSRAELLVGVDRVFWGVTEALHLVDIINQTNLVESPDTEDKLGQPMLRLTVDQRWGSIALFVLPVFREQRLPGSNGRLRAPIPFANDARFESSRRRSHLDLAIRYSHYIGNIEFALSHFGGTERLPFIVPDRALLTNPAAQITPYYFQTDQTGLEATLVAGNWLWKFEGVSKRSVFDRYFAATGGFEYNLNNLAGGKSDLGVIVEYQYDDRNDISVSAFNNDLVIGARLARNDFADSQLLVLVSHDRDSAAKLYSLEASRRIGKRYRAALEARFFSSTDANDPLSLLNREDYWQFEITRFF